MMMQFVFALLAFAGVALAQGVQITAPLPGATVVAGSTFGIDIARPNSLSSSQDVSVAIGLATCGTSCDANDTSDTFGTILFAGPYNPTHHGLPSPEGLDYYSNYTLAVPGLFPPGEASLKVAHFTLIGAGMNPYIDTHNITVNVVGGSAKFKF
ncbi:hypothetical protein EIP91_010769 [Steccherinum ochraceum]|uniref:Uncharacterized protein n=1 Tax=Steccherinum ochraceum TaxID=92696 RepID=A0A4R0RC90_9APHY|nr:hypothetical protein EIP91_010769 [Steccherinum ochraceum]